jgi:hypothetical protein
VVKVSKAPVDLDGGRVRNTRRLLVILGPALVVFGFFRLTPGAPSGGGWQEVTGDGKFSVMLPGPATGNEHVVNSPLGAVTVHSYVAVPDPGGADFRVRYSDLPAPATYEGMPQPLQPDLSGQRDFVEKSAGGLWVKLEYVWVGRRQYVMMRTAKSVVLPEDGRFFSSFRVVMK